MDKENREFFEKTTSMPLKILEEAELKHTQQRARASDDVKEGLKEASLQN